MTTDHDPLLTRLTAWAAQRPWLVDALIVAVIVGLGSAREPDDVQDFAVWFCSLGLALPLFYRRPYPVITFLVVAGLSLVVWAADVQAFGFSALLVALYTVASTQPLRTTFGAAGIVEVGIVLASATWAPHHHPEDAIVALTGLSVAASVLGVNVLHRKALVASLQERAERLEAERDQQGRLAASAERARIAREMHDIVAHNVSVMIALADGASYALHDRPERAEEAMLKASRTGREALTEMRRLLGVLREDEPADTRTPQPGIDQLDLLVDQVRAAGVPTALTITGAPPEHVSGSLQLAVYRIVQESLTNALKHGGPGVSAAVALRWAGNRLSVEVTNTGQGISAPAHDALGGGLRGMRERASVYDGTVSAGPRPEGGWVVSAALVQPTTVQTEIEAHA